MTRTTSFDAITDDLIQRYVAVLKPLAGWGQVGGTGAVYGELGLPMPAEPFPACYVYLAGQQHDYSGGSSLRRDLNTVTLRIIGGPSTPGYKVHPERAVYAMVTAVVNELDYRPYLQDPSNSDAPFRYMDAAGKLQVGTVGRIQAFGYSDQGSYIGIEIPTLVALQFNMGRLS